MSRMLKRIPETRLFWLFVLAGLVALDAFLAQKLFRLDFAAWLLRNGAAIELGITLFALALGDLNRYPDLVSADPLEYGSQWCNIVGAATFTWGTEMRGGSRSLAMIPLTIGFAAVALFTLFVVVPVNYFVYLLCGAPAREFAGRQRQVYVARMAHGGIQADELPAQAPVPPGGESISFSGKPLALTSAISTGCSGLRASGSGWSKQSSTEAECSGTFGKEESTLLRISGRGDRLQRGEYGRLGADVRGLRWIRAASCYMTRSRNGQPCPFD